ncbi:MAG: hypothetical protein VB142_12485 [Burkholderia sp.]
MHDYRHSRANRAIYHPLEIQQRPQKLAARSVRPNCSCPNRSMFIRIIMKSLPLGMPFGRSGLLLHFNLETTVRKIGQEARGVP